MSNLATKHRPQDFSEVVGQENTIKILHNQIKKNEIKHGYLFTGGAGTGKTTIARIFAKEINVEKKLVKWQDDQENKFHTEMRSIAELKRLSDDLDLHDIGHVIEYAWTDEELTSGVVRYIGEVIEIDAASNTGVDNIRDIRENCRFKPIAGGYKVYVIDECHMLSTGAWNALLKVLEEPPSHVVFLFCTTDPQKIPATILSRVQRFNFTRMTTEQIIHRLEEILHYEESTVGYNVEPDALEYIAKLANGGMRDAISILDTCLSYKEETETLTVSDIVKIIGTIDYERLIQLIYWMLDWDKENVILTIEKLHYEGKDLRQFIKNFMELILDIEKYNIIGNFSYLTVPISYESDFERLIKYDLFDICFERLTKLQEWIKYDSNPKVLIEGCFILLIDSIRERR